jgi:uncharacterized protein (DUF362 family)
MADPTITRRRLMLGLSAAAAAAGVGAIVGRELRQPEATVFGLRCATYEEDLVGRIREGIAAFPSFKAKIPGSRVVLKPNLVEVHADRPVNTDPRLILAAIEAFRKEGAKNVVVAEGPGHLRDTDAVLEASGLGRMLREQKVTYVDLNVDDAVELVPVAGYTKLPKLPVARMIMQADLVVSMPKLKTHHWAGVTLSMKNLFGTVPGRVFGWPKNPLHWAGVDNSVAELWSSIRPAFTIVDGVVGMEGDGPIMGVAVPHGILLFGDNLPAVDATATRLMGLRPEKVRSIRLSLAAGGTTSAWRILRIGDELPVHPYAVLASWTHLKA